MNCEYIDFLHDLRENAQATKFIELAMLQR